MRSKMHLSKFFNVNQRPIEGILFGFLCLMLTCMTGCKQESEQQALAASDSRPNDSVAVDVVPTVVADITESIELVGNLIARRCSIIVSEVDGVICEIPSFGGSLSNQSFPQPRRLDLGIAVKKGDVVARLSPELYELKFKAAQARHEAAQSELDHLKAWRRDEEIEQAKAVRDEAAARLTLSEEDLKRAQELLKKETIPQAEFDVAEMQSKVAQATLRRSEAELKMAQAGPTPEQIAVRRAAVAQAKAEVDRAGWELDKTVIRAPYDGVITDRFVDEGDRVTAMPRVEIMELVDQGVVGAQLGVPERYAGQIHLGDMAEVYVKGDVKPIPGMVGLINDKVDPESRTFRIRVAVNNDQQLLKVGQFVRVILRIDRSAMTLTVPTEAVTYDGGEAAVFVCQNGRAHRKPVKLGINDGRRVEILSGLTAGEMVVIRDPAILSDGMAIQARSVTPQLNTSMATP